MFDSKKSIRVLLLGKGRSLVLWLENLEQAFISLGYSPAIFVINGDNWTSRLRSKIKFFDSNSHWMLSRFELSLNTFRPNLVIVVGAFGIPINFYKIMHSQSQRPIVVGLVGDRFSIPDCIERANLCDKLYFTDTFFLEESKNAGIKANGSYLPLAVNPEIFRPGYGARRKEILLVASRTELRESVVRQLHKPAFIIGTDWSTLEQEKFHLVQNRKINRDAVIRLYQHHQAVLNIRNEANVEHGLNQRSFEPLACGAVVLNDDLPDLEICFEPGKEILVYRNPEELNMLVDRLELDPKFAEIVAIKGRERILAEHTFKHRIKKIINDLNM